MPQVAAGGHCLGGDKATVALAWDGIKAVECLMGPGDEIVIKGKHYLDLIGRAQFQYANA